MKALLVGTYRRSLMGTQLLIPQPWREAFGGGAVYCTLVSECARRGKTVRYVSVFAAREAAEDALGDAAEIKKCTLKNGRFAVPKAYVKACAFADTVLLAGRGDCMIIYAANAAPDTPDTEQVLAVLDSYELQD